ncbi:MAG: Integral rane protein [Peptococcaceae bacterium]|jgi:uncharacterized membrane protein YgaE (UPF0421/DUF939 family)|nr:Integral rane protein [Peptococcaceae bacterium]
MIIGARVLKTGIAVALSMFICNMLDIQPAIFAGAATVVNLQPSVGQSLLNAREQVFVHFISIGIAVLLGLLIGPNPFSMGVATILIIMVCNRLKWRSAISTGVVAAIFILGSPTAKFLDHALIRSLAIFIGLGVAMFVNATIAPPRYRESLIQKLLELNRQTSDSFIQAVNGYLNLTILTPEEWGQHQAKTEALFNDAQKLYNLYRNNLGLEADHPSTAKEKEAKFYSEYIAYNKGLWQRTRDILFLAQERKERRKEAGDLPISPEFQEILELLRHVLELYILYNKELIRKLQGQNTPPVEEPRIWSKLDLILNRWHDRFPSGSYYLHALIEVALITYKLRWAAKESVRLLQE